MATAQGKKKKEREKSAATAVEKLKNCVIMTGFYFCVLCEGESVSRKETRMP